MELIEGFASLLEEFRGVFNAQSFPIFVELMTGWTLSHRHRFVTDLMLSSGSVGKRHFSNYHRFFSQYAWSLEAVSKCLLLLLVRIFVPNGVIELSVDDTFEHPANRKEKAVRRTAPMAMVLYSLIVVWFHCEGHRHVEFPHRPWYRRKKEPAFGDMLTTLRRLSWKKNYGDIAPKRGRAKKLFDQITCILCLAG